MNKTRTLYDVLQVTPNAAPQIMRAAFEHLSAHHELAGDPAAARLVRDAYATLSRPEARAAYDRKLAELAAETTPVPSAATPAAPGLPLWARVAALVLAVGVGYGVATMWHQRELARMILDHQAQLVERQAQIQALRMERLAERDDQRAERSAARQATYQEQAEARRRERELNATLNRLDRQADSQRREQAREEQAREREARRRLEQERRERAAADARNAALAQQRLAAEKQELNQLYKDNYPRYR
ncbi:hypothetical protein G3580_15860 [Nitrogeniibacter mangrovi]|uniref:J domain-containing protein n=1 Tax=Nitrogeniibacter mangrovi TaxID=2016596 RepID=A0A6C1B5G9_9RHOO|nr:hypothetical protein [Nitrogeniibacter mangrovi]QID18966.1 hypothetical protein G3580_15860 [Nitrogeniibacter mangrovi]